MAIHVTETQKLIVKSAYLAASERGEDIDQQTCEEIVRAMLLIERSGMQPYFLKGYNWSCRSRAHGNHRQIEEESEELEARVEEFNFRIATSQGHAASRIRSNRVRSIKAIEGHDNQLLVAEARFGEYWQVALRRADFLRFGQANDVDRPDPQVNAA